MPLLTLKIDPEFLKILGLGFALNYNQPSLKITQGLFQSAVIPPLKIEDF